MNDLSVIAGVVALPTGPDASPLQANRNPRGGKVFFAKRALIIRTGRTFDLIVPNEERKNLAIGWGNDSLRLASQLHVSCHDTQAKWLTFSGGYFVTKPRCISLIVRTENAENEVQIGVGARCASK